MSDKKEKEPFLGKEPQTADLTVRSNKPDYGADFGYLFGIGCYSQVEACLCDGAVRDDRDRLLEYDHFLDSQGDTGSDSYHCSAGGGSRFGNFGRSGAEGLCL